MLFKSLQAQDTLTLEDIFQKIDSANPVSKIYEAQIRSSDEAAKGAYSWMPPEVGGGSWMVPYNPKFIRKDASGNAGMGQFMLSAQQMFPNRKKQNAEAGYLNAVSSVDKEKKKTALNDLYALAKKYYYQWIIAKKKLAVTTESESVLNFMIKSAEISYKNNVGKLNAYYKAKAALGNLLNTRLMMQSDIRQSLIALNTLMNRYQLQSFEIDSVYVIKEFIATDFDSAHLTETRSDIKAIDKNVELTYLKQQTEKASLRPEIGVRFDHMTGLGGIPMQYNLLAMVKIPIAKWSSRGAKANIESLKWKTEALQQERQMAINDALGIAYNMQNEIDLKKKQLKLYEQNIIPALRKNFQVMQLGYEQNTGELFELYDAWETLNISRLEYFEQLKQLLAMQAELERTLQIK